MPVDVTRRFRQIEKGITGDNLYTEAVLKNGRIVFRRGAGSSAFYYGMVLAFTVVLSLLLAPWALPVPLNWVLGLPMALWTLLVLAGTAKACAPQPPFLEIDPEQDALIIHRYKEADRRLALEDVDYFIGFCLAHPQIEGLQQETYAVCIGGRARLLAGFEADAALLSRALGPICDKLTLYLITTTERLEDFLETGFTTNPGISSGARFDMEKLMVRATVVYRPGQQV